MTISGNISDMQLEHLLRVVNTRRDAQCQQRQQQAQQQADALLRAAYHDARQRLHEEIRAAAARHAAVLAAAQAQRETRQRQHRQQQEQALLAKIWQPLRAALMQRWQQPQSREQWVNGLLQRATAAILQRQWQIDYPAGFSEQERQRIQTKLAASGIKTSFAEDPELLAGLRIRADEAELDGSIDALLGRKSHVESRVLATLRELQAEGETA